MCFCHQVLDKGGKVTAGLLGSLCCSVSLCILVVHCVVILRHWCWRADPKGSDALPLQESGVVVYVEKVKSIVYLCWFASGRASGT